jgi:hypothetical protein
VSKNPKTRRATVSLPTGTSPPYDPLDLRTLAESMAKVVLEQPVHPLAQVPVFEGAGVYVITLCESLFIDRSSPIWNRVIDDFDDKKVVGAGREGQL